jgi:alcohol dehydrogenase
MDSSILFNLRKFIAPEIVYGSGAIQLAGRHAKNFGATKVLVVSDSGVQQNGWTEIVEQSLSDVNIDFCTFTDITSNPKDHEVATGAEVYHSQACDLIIAVGGGSPMDCAKGIGVLVTNGSSIDNFEGIDEIAAPVPPLIFIPTTAGTSADVSQFAIITDSRRKVKFAVISKMVIPDIALIDPQTTITMPPDLTAATGMDALCHAFEAFVSTASSPLTDMAAMASVRLIAKNLLGAYREPDNMRFRENMMMASLMAGLAFSNASLGVVHAMAHSLGGALGLAHGECNSILLEKVVKYNYPVASAKYDQLAEAMGLDMSGIVEQERATAVASCVESLRKQLDISYRLNDMGVTLEDLPGLSESAFHDPCVATNPRETNQKDIEEIYKQIF